MDDWTRRRAEWDEGCRVASSRARLAIVALVATAASRTFVFGMDALSEPRVMALGQVVELGLVVLTTIAFLRWLARMVSLASAMSRLPLRWNASTAVWSFFMPIVSLWRPYQVIRDLHALLAPDAVPEPAPQPVLDGSGGYREIPMKAPPPRLAVPSVSIGAWWAAFLAARTLDNAATTGMDAFGALLTVASAALAVFLVRAIDGRLAERHRRLHHASDAELEAWHLRA